MSFLRFRLVGVNCVSVNLLSVRFLRARYLDISFSLVSIAVSVCFSLCLVSRFLVIKSVTGSVGVICWFSAVDSLFGH
jgi:hypothetical protein